MSLSSWAPSSIPTSTTLRSINPTHSSDLYRSFTSAAAHLSTATKINDVITYSRIVRGAQASLDIISAEQVQATATDDTVKAQATQQIFNTTLNLLDLANEENLYSLRLGRPPNIIYLVVFTVVFLFTAGMIVKSRYHWYNVTYFCGYGLQFAGFLGRVLSFSDDTNFNYYLLQYVSLTISPAFIMAGVYFLFAQLVVIHGREYSVMKPMWYSYFFITTDVLSLIIQAAGGGAASAASKASQDAKPGTDTMTAGIVLQVVAMTVFLTFWFEFLHRIYFRHRADIADDDYTRKYKKRSFANVFRFITNAKSIRPYRQQQLSQFYNPKFEHIRSRPLFPYMPLAITVTVIVVYIRCVYRVVELIQGFDGYLITHEVFLMTLDALMLAIAGLIAIPFHPVFVFGTDNKVKLAHIKQNVDEKINSDDEKHDSDAEATRVNESSNNSHQGDQPHLDAAQRDNQRLSNSDDVTAESSIKR